MKERFSSIIRSLLCRPTSPFNEQSVVDTVRQWAEGSGVLFRWDKAGNVFLRHKSAGGGGPKWFFTAHLDHPGFTAVRQTGRILKARFWGGVAPEYFRGSQVRFFWPEGQARGEIRSVSKRKKGSHFVDCRVRMAGNSRLKVPAGAVGMWDLPACRISGHRLVSRGCDDVVGSAAAICALDQIISSGIKADVTVLLTRAEEAGFVGALAACENRSIPSDAMLVSIETSKAQPAARLGDGVVVRVGDKAWTFDPTLTAQVTAVASQLAQKDKSFRFVRQLMPGGVCESTCFCIFGYTAAALCLPLGNYHNMGTRKKIAAERIDLGDFECLVKLLVALAADARPIDSAKKHLHARLQKLLADLERLL
ncbi:MAG: M20/M25/M40 family metallo-hydrolase [Planctomycetes bacterium]|nr:M20/M25/M40 family metallo-hydrolase [Planctomycetota bacterium]